LEIWFLGDREDWGGEEKIKLKLGKLQWTLPPLTKLQVEEVKKRLVFKQNWVLLWSFPFTQRSIG